MKIAIPKQGNGWHLLSNEGLSVGDEVFPLVEGYSLGDKFFITDMIRSSDEPFRVVACTGWPSEPHIIVDFYQNQGLQWVRTNKGYGNIERYFKLILPSG